MATRNSQDVSNQLNLGRKATEVFARTFLEKYLTFGFQSLGKKDIELLLFYALEQSQISNISPTLDNHIVAHRLKLTPDKVRKLRREAMARWGDEASAGRLLRRQLHEYFSDAQSFQNDSSARTNKVQKGRIDSPFE